ncbi:hypothetical protein FHU38_003727 [Saccharomonospora amisosensis]|uniref:DUF2795 domain-containing protein n=1 Tax=Saccharomonospora amisosensis TaxID=1128677 RepID=A0A7X5USI3_9PSEU|nr:DUF2795 domain-containing protein [Saccharomonospora amisosensis]NIJ13383.1 hypothetical protein [Saccharomonospora amisosensis]
MATTVERLRTALSEADFPADKSQLLRQAEHAEADGATLKALRAIPPVVYSNLTEVKQSVSFDAGPDASEEAARRRLHDKPGLAQREKDVPGHPIADELGENRGS